MSNHGDPWRKFVQTFFLAEQPNGYFVLNDIFRFLKEDTVEDDVSEADTGATTAPSEPTAPEPSSPEPVAEPVLTPPRELTPPPAPILEEEEEEPTTVQPEPVTPPPAYESNPAEPNGIHHEEPEPQPDLTDLSESSPAPSAAPSLPEPAPPAPAPEPQAPPLATSPAPPPPAPTQQPPVSLPIKPSAPKSWASLAATDSKRWGSQVATDSKGLTEVPATSSSPASGTQSPAPHGLGHRGGQQHGSREPPAVTAALALTTPQCFVKGVIEPVSQAQLSQVLTQRFGVVKDVEIVRSKACAFLEFLSLDAAKKAIITSLPQSQGGEGGIRIDVGGEVGQVRIVIETRKERGERPPSQPRRGGHIPGDARGGFRGGRGGFGGRGRGGPPPPPSK
jgi:hypothetical protein